MTIGPVQLVVLGFEGGSFTGEILPELRRLRDHDVIHRPVAAQRALHRQVEVRRRQLPFPE